MRRERNAGARSRRARSVVHEVPGAARVRWLGERLHGAFQRGPHRQWIRVSPLALCLVAALLMLAPASRAQAATRATPVRSAQPSPPPQPPIARWSDTSNATAFSVVLQAGATPLGPAASSPTSERLHPRGEFTFTLQTGDVVHGIVGVTGPDASNLDTQDTTALGPSSKGPVCLAGELISRTAFAPPLVTAPPPTTVHPVLYVLRAHFDDDGLVAFAHVSYVETNLASDEPYLSALCGSGVDSPHTGDLVAGCPSFTAPCVNPLDTALPSVSSFDSALTQAVKSGDWHAVYSTMSQSITGQYTEQEFATAIEAQLDSTGRITAFSPVRGAPQLQTGTVGQPFFAVTQTATISRQGQTSSRQITSYFLLEQGVWHFWFSQ